VRAGVDAAALVTAPGEPAGLERALEELAATKELAAGVFALVETVLPWVGGVYRSHLAVAAPVTEASVMEVLVEARREGAMEIKGGRAIIGVLSEDGTPSGHVGEAVKQVFALERVSPAVRPG
jgi:hypothetical protein